MITVTASAEIDAPIERVYAVLLDFAGYPAWNPFVRAVGGEARVGGFITLDVHFPDGRRSRSREVIERIEPPGDRAELAWRFVGPLASTGLVRASRRQVLTRLDGERTRYETEEVFTGLLVGLLPRAALERATQDAAAALETRAEQGGAG